MGKIYCIMGKSSSGKDSLFREIKKRMPHLKMVIPYTTRPIREGEKNGVEYYFVNEEKLKELEERGRVIEKRTYNTKYGVWAYFTADDGQIMPEEGDYLIIGTLESYNAMKNYYGNDKMAALYVELEDGLRLLRALERERRQREPGYEEVCRRFLADSADFSEENLEKAGIQKRFYNCDFEQCVQEMCDYIKKQEALTGEKL